jgi:hypothetical protein
MRPSRTMRAAGLAALAVLAAAALASAAAGSSRAPTFTKTGRTSVAGAHAAATAAAPALSTPAFTLFSDFGAGHAYDCCVGWTVAGPASGPGLFSAALPFTPAVDARVTQIDVAVSNAGGANGPLTIQLAADDGGVPGAVYGTWTVFSGVPVFGTCCQIETIHVSPSLPVGQGRQYWVVASTSGSDTWDAWNWNSVGATGTELYNQGSGWLANLDSPLGAFDVLGVPKLSRV